MMNKFISYLDNASFPSLEHGCAVSCCFDVCHYQDSLFQSFAVQFDASLIRAVAKRKAEFLAGRICAQQALHLLGEPNSTVYIGEARSPVFPSAMIGSISHTQDSAICVVAPRSRYLALGIDQENWLSKSTGLECQKHIINPEEWALRDNQSLDGSEFLTLCFSAKESFFKAYYPFVKRYFGFEEAIVSEVIIMGNMGRLTLVPKPSISSYLPDKSAFIIHFMFAGKGVISYHQMQING